MPDDGDDKSRYSSRTHTITQYHEDLDASSSDELSPDRQNSSRKNNNEVRQYKNIAQQRNSRKLGADRSAKQEGPDRHYLVKKRQDSNTRTHKHTQPLHTIFTQEEEPYYSSGPDDHSDRDYISMREVLEVQRHPQDRKNSHGGDCYLPDRHCRTTNSSRDDCHRDRDSKNHHAYRDSTGDHQYSPVEDSISSRRNSFATHRKDNYYHDSRNGEDYHASDHHRRSHQKQKRDCDSSSANGGEHYAFDHDRRSHQKQKRDCDSSSANRGEHYAFDHHRRSYQKRNDLYQDDSSRGERNYDSFSKY